MHLLGYEPFFLLEHDLCPTPGWGSVDFRFSESMKCTLFKIQILKGICILFITLRAQESCVTSLNSKQCMNCGAQSSESLNKPSCDYLKTMTWRKAKKSKHDLINKTRALLLKRSDADTCLGWNIQEWIKNLLNGSNSKPTRCPVPRRINIGSRYQAEVPELRQRSAVELDHHRAELVWAPLTEQEEKPDFHEKGQKYTRFHNYYINWNWVKLHRTA